MKIKITDLIIDEAIQIRAKLDPKLVERYVECYDALPPIDVFKVAAGNLLADGFHRRASALKLGKTTMEATIHEGTWEDAEAFAITANLRHGKPLTAEERNEGVRRLLDLPGWSHRKIADATGIPDRTITNIAAAGKVEKVLTLRRAAQIPSPAIVYEIATAPEETWVNLATRAVEDEWSRDATREVVKVVNDPEADPALKTGILAGALAPTAKGRAEAMAARLNDPAVSHEEKLGIVQSVMVRDEHGQPGVPATLVAAVMADGVKKAALPAIYGFLEATARLLGQLNVDPDPLGGIDHKERSNILKRLNDAQEAIDRLRDLIEPVQ